MNFHSTRIVLQQFVLWCVLAAVVALLTLLFTVLGTITCAVLMGMMMAAIKHRPLQVLLISLVFPAVVIAMVRFAKVELPGPQQILLPVLCFAVFWFIYFATFALIRFEKRQAAAQSAAPPAAAAENGAPALVALSRNGAPARIEPATPPVELQLEELQGRWSCDAGADGQAGRKIIEVVGHHLSLTLVAADGGTRLIAEGDLTLRKDGATGTRPPRLPFTRAPNSGDSPRASSHDSSMDL